MSKVNRLNVNKSDFERVVLTDTVPYEVPLIFSNDGFYKNCRKVDSKYFIQQKLFDYISRNDHNFFIPLHYRIIKDEFSLRKLSLLHPASQVRFVDFYKEYSGIVCYHCSAGNASLRAPEKISDSFYISNANENINKYKSPSVNTTSSDMLVRHSSSYFSYSGYDRIHKFFDSELYLKLEKKYSEMWVVDVAKCFDSIYTHTISWAVKSKDFAKSSVSIKTTFGQKFDRLMQQCNHNETNGIVIGPEVSRIFAEIILQDIDKKVINSLFEKKKYVYGRDYVFKRYVDDNFIFSNDKLVSKDVVAELVDQLANYHLHINDRKVEKHQRPFYTDKSKMIRQAGIEINNLVNKFTERKVIKEGFLLLPSQIRRPSRLKRDFISSIKSFCYDLDNGFSAVSGYIISSLSNRVDQLSSVTPDDKNDRSIETNYRNSFIFMIDLMFYFYSVCPSVNSSYKLCKAIIISAKFFETNYPESAPTVKQTVLELTVAFLKKEYEIDGGRRDNVIPLEKLNVVLAISEFGDDYLLPREFVEKLFFSGGEEAGYFETMCCLFYIKNNESYSSIKKMVLKSISNTLLGKLSEANYKSEIVYFLVDSLSCPYLSVELRRSVTQEFYSDCLGIILDDPSADEVVSSIEENEWFIGWREVDLLNTLEKKELNRSY